MIEVLAIDPRQLKGTDKNGRNYDFYVQKTRVQSVDRDGIETSDVVEIQSDPGEVLSPADDYVVHPTSVYAMNTVGKDGRTRKRLAIPGNPKLIRFDELARSLGYVKAPAQAKAA